MVLHTIIGEYDILYAQERELAGYGGEAVPQAVLSTNPQDFLETTALSCAYTGLSAQDSSRPYSASPINNTNTQLKNV